MEYIRLLYVSNSLIATAGQQTMSFLLRVANIGYHKNVEIVWAGSDGIWQRLPADFVCSADADHEYWQAKFSLSRLPLDRLPGTIRFALHLQCADIDTWDNNAGQDYQCPADNIGRLNQDVAVQMLSPIDQLSPDQRSVEIKLATDASLKIDKISIHWTTDDWQHRHKISCRTLANRKRPRQATATPLKAAQHWHTRIQTGNAFRLQYCICYETKHQTWWDNNHGNNYNLSHRPLKVLILNLHCYQEEHQADKFRQISKAIDEHAVDLVCLQEVAEHWNHGEGDWSSNSANIINQQLTQAYFLYSDWSHLGFDKYREGVAILSRYPLTAQEARYVSDNSDAYSIHSRKVVAANVQVPYIGWINLYSAHLSWWEDGFQAQFQHLSAWADSRQKPETCATLLCGDFNIAAGSIGYRQIVDANQFEDQYLAANAPALFQQIFRVNDAHWQNTDLADYRIDYIFMNKCGQLRVTSAQILFTEQDYGRVSDHFGYLMTFEPITPTLS